MAHLRWVTTKPRRTGFFWFRAVYRRTGSEAHRPEVVEITKDDFYPGSINLVDGSYFGLAGRNIVRYWAGPILQPEPPKKYGKMDKG